MGITSSGPWCDVCGDIIFPFGNEKVNFLKVAGIDGNLICDNECKKKILSVGKDWKKLPDGPLRRAFENAQKEGKQ